MHAHTLANMSPRCRARSFVLSVVVFLAVTWTEVTAFAIRSPLNTTRTPAPDLAVDESAQLEVRHDFNSTNNLNTNISNKSNEVPASISYPSNSGYNPSAIVIEMAATTRQAPDVVAELLMNNTTTKNNISERSVVKENTTVRLQNNVATKTPLVSGVLPVTEYYTTPTDPEFTAAAPQPAANSMSLPAESIHVRAINDTLDELSTAPNDTVQQIAALDQLATISLQSINTLADKNISELPRVNSGDYFDGAANSTSRRKYTVIDRITKTTKKKSENKAESLVILTSATSDEVLARVATEYPSATTPGPRLVVVPATTSDPDIFVTQEIENITDTFEVSIQKPKFEWVASKRAGFLNYSSKSKQNESTIENITTETAYRGHTTLALGNSFDAVTGRAGAGAGGSESQSYLDEDAIKEEMLQETSLQNNEELTQQTREGRVNNTNTTFSFLEQLGFFTSTQDLEGTLQTNTEEIINTKPSQDRGKSTVVYTVYTVSPNYKPMKKLEIQPPKLFVRDPDDNSWRNESISSLGIVFKPKNSSKPFTQVLKNKTETEWSSLLSRDSKSDAPDLRERLEKIAQKRKTKKKKTDFFGNVIYSDYEESNSSEEVTNTRNSDLAHTLQSTLEDTTVPSVLAETQKEFSTSTLTAIPSTSPTAANTTVAVLGGANDSKTNINSTATKTPLKVSSKVHNITKEILSRNGKYNSTAAEEQKYFNVFDYYDISNEDESEYLQLAKLELKKFAIPSHVTQKPFATTPHLPYRLTKPETLSVPERMPTIQYFPPRISTQRTKPNRFDHEFETKIKSHTKISSPKEVTSFTLKNAPDTPLGKYSSRYQEEQHNVHPTHVTTVAPVATPHTYHADDYTKPLPPTAAPGPPTQHRANDHTEHFHRASYVMKNYKDFIEQAAKDYDYERDAGFMTYTPPPPPAPGRGVTISDLLAQERDRPNTNLNEDYDAKFRKDVMQRFVDNFNHNDARYRGHFPLLYNNTVMHANVAGGSEAAARSRAFLKGLYSPVKARAGHGRREPYDPACDHVTVELSPAYELHYYVPEQEEREEIESKPLS